MNSHSRFIDRRDEQQLQVQTPADRLSLSETSTSISFGEDVGADTYADLLRDNEHDLVIQPGTNVIRLVKVLGKGGSGRVDLVRFDGQLMVMKTLLKSENIYDLLMEFRVQRELAGAGGAPEVHGLGLNPARVFMDYTGKTYEEYIGKCTQKELIESLAIVAYKLNQIHEMGFVHNDLKVNNITVGASKDIDIHIIDFGLTTKIGDFLQLSDRLGRRPWYAPELYEGVPSSPAGDVYSLGVIISRVLRKVNDADVYCELVALKAQAKERSPADRPSLQTVISKLRHLAAG